MKRIVMLKGHAETKTTATGAPMRELYSAGCTYNVDDELGAKFLDEGLAHLEGDTPPGPVPQPLRGTDGRRPTLIGGKRFYDHVQDDPTPKDPVQARGEDGRRPTLVGGKRVFGSVVPTPEADAPAEPQEDDTLEGEFVRSSADAETREPEPTDEELDDEAIALEADDENEPHDPEALEPEED